MDIGEIIFKAIRKEIATAKIDGLDSIENILQKALGIAYGPSSFVSINDVDEIRLVLKEARKQRSKLYNEPT